MRKRRLSALKWCLECLKHLFGWRGKLVNVKKKDSFHGLHGQFELFKGDEIQSVGVELIWHLIVLTESMKWWNQKVLYYDLRLNWSSVVANMMGLIVKILWKVHKTPLILLHVVHLLRPDWQVCGPRLIEVGKPCCRLSFIYVREPNLPSSNVVH